MSKPVVFDDFSKAPKDLMKDDYCNENKLTFKTKAGKANLTFEAKGTADVVSKIQVAVQPIEKINIKKLSIDSKSVLVSELDFVKLLKNTTFTYRGESDIQAKCFKKNEIGMKYVNDVVALDTTYDLKKTDYKFGAAVSTRYGLFGLKAFGALKNEKALTSVDLAMKREFEKFTLTCQSQNYFKSASLTLLTAPFENAKLASSIELPITDSTQTKVSFGAHITPYEGQEYRIKVDNNGLISGVWKVNVEDKLIFSTTVQMEGKNLSTGKHTLAAAVEFKF